MKVIKHNRSIIAMTLAIGFGIFSTGAFAMTTEHDEQPANLRSGTPVAQTDAERRTADGDFVYVGGRVGYVLLPSGGNADANRAVADENFVDIGGRVGFVLMPSAVN